MCVGGFVKPPPFAPMTRHSFLWAGPPSGLRGPAGSRCHWDAGLRGAGAGEVSAQPEISCDSWPWAVSGSKGPLRLLDLKWLPAAGKSLAPSEAGLLVPVAWLQLRTLGLLKSG